MTAKELRQKYIAFFITKNHKQIAGKSLIPENDPTVLFTTAGMHPLVPYLLGEEHPAGKRLVNCQKCIRTGDIDEVGDVSHCTFFEMLGNWSLGDYFKEQAIHMSYEFITDNKWLGLPKENLYVTVFAGDNHTPRDGESAKIWMSLGIPEYKIFFLPCTDNFWGPAGLTGPCGPDTEMFFDTGKNPCSKNCRPGCSCGKYFEIWNDVFMQYNKKDESTYAKLKRKCVDTGMGVERTIAMLQGKSSVYETEVFSPIIKSLEDISGKNYGVNPDTDKSIRIIADHIKAATFILGDEQAIKPSNLGQGYILRRLIRRAIRHGRKLALENRFLTIPVKKVIQIYQEIYPELKNRSAEIITEMELEEERFLKTLAKGEHEFEKLLPNLKKNPKKIIPGRVAFRLYDTYGFPLEITEELAQEEGLTIDRDGFKKAFEKHQQLSKQGADKSFKGGLADHTEEVKKLHTATHLLHKALKMVLGDHVAQRGSNINAQRLRFDFVHGEKMSEKQIKQVEDIVNKQIERDLHVTLEIMKLDQALKTGAIALFKDQYEDKVKVYSIGDFSKEVCGGPHVEKTGILGKFRIIKEQSSSAGIRRIRAVLEN